MILAALLVLAAFVGIQFYREAQKNQVLAAEKANLNTELNKINAENTAKQQELDESKTDAWAEEQAREKLGMVKPGEIKIVDEDK